MLAFFTTQERGQADQLLVAASARLRARGIHLAGAVQVNTDRPGSHRCDMDLHILDGDDTIRISQNLGRESRGCRLDPGGLERAVGLVETALTHRPDLLIVNKFGKQETDGRGFRPAIGTALAHDIPVLTAVASGNRAAFLEFCDGLAAEIAPEVDAICAWVDGVTGAATSRTAAAG